MTKDRSTLFKTLYDSHSPMVLQMCMGYMKGNTQEAQDLVQEIFTIVWQKLDSFRGEAQHKTWLYRITVNTCLHQLRKQKKTRMNSWVELNKEPISEETDHQKEEQHQALFRAIGELEEVDRILIMMSLEGEKQDVIAEVLGIKPGALRVRMHRIKKALSNQLKTN